MNRKKLLKIVLISSIIGVYFLFIIAEFFEYSNTDLCDIKDGKVEFIAKITKINSYENVTFFEFSNNNCSIKGVIFEYVKIPKNIDYIIKGETSVYEGEKEIIVEEVLLLK